MCNAEKGLKGQITSLTSFKDDSGNITIVKHEKNADTTNKDPKDKTEDNLPLESQPIFVVLDKLKLIEKKAGAPIEGYY